MKFLEIILDRETAVLSASAEGHASDVVDAFRQLAKLAFEGQGAWRITLVHGICTPNMQLESESVWKLRAERKVDHQARPYFGMATSTLVD